MVNTLKGQDANQKDLDRLEQQSQKNLMRFNKYIVLDLDQGNPRCQYKLGDERTEHSPVKKGLGGTGGWETEHEPVMCPHSPESQLYPGCIKRSMVSSLREMILPLCSVLRPHLEYHIQLWSPQCRRNKDLLEYIQRRDTKIIIGMCIRTIRSGPEPVIEHLVKSFGQPREHSCK